jgi:CrcB protein
MIRFLAICLGGALGTGARYLIAEGFERRGWTAFPWAILTINLLGSFLLALILTATRPAGDFERTLQLTLTVGVMGGFTTYSTFNYDTLRLFERGAGALALANVAATLLGCLAAGGLGWVVGRALFSG